MSEQVLRRRAEKKREEAGVPGVVVDLEWDPALPKEDILCVGYGAKSFRPKVLRPELVPDADKSLLQDGAFLVEFSKSDAVKLLDHGWRVGHVADIQVMAWLLNENQPLDLESVTWKYLKRKMDKRLLRTKNRVLFRKNNGQYVPIYRAPRAQLHAYCRRDIVTEMDLFEELVNHLTDVNLLDYFREEEMPYTRVLIDMERTGLPIDIDRSEELREKLEAEHEALESDLRGMAGAPTAFLLSSPDHVRAYLFSRKVTIKSRITVEQAGEDMPRFFHPDPEGHKRLYVHGAYVFPGLGLRAGFKTAKANEDSTSRRALLLNPVTAEHPWVQKYLEWQKVHKLLTTYLRVFPQRVETVFSHDHIEETRIRSHYNQTGTKTGRLSSSDINLQNIPARGERGKLIRGLFTTHPDIPFLMGDFSQLETRIMAHDSQDPYLLKVFKEGTDPFLAMASDIYGRKITKEDPERGATKNVWYAQGYGAMPDKMWEMIALDGGDMDLLQVTQLYDEMQTLLGTYFEYREHLIADAKAKGYVKTIGGRKRRIRFTKGMTWKAEAHGERAAANARMQGSAADIVRRVMIRFHSQQLALCAQVHDELLYQFRWKMDPVVWETNRKLLMNVAEEGHGYDLSVPLVFDAKIATSWGDK